MELLELKNDKILPFRFKKLKNGKFFLSNDYGGRIIMNSDDFQKFVTGEKLEANIESALCYKFFQLPIGEELTKELIKDLGARWLVRNSYILSGPSLHIIVVTLYCNHGCKYCHASAITNNPMKYHMSKEMAQKAVDIIFQTTSGNISIEFQGGEPLSNWEVVKHTIEYAREKNKDYGLELSFALVSNLTLMDDEKLDFLMSEDIGISTSLDGQKEVHDYNRVYLTGKSSFDEVCFWIKKINQKYIEKGMKQRVGAVATATKKSLDYPKEIVDTYIGLGLDSIFMRALNPFGMALKLWDQLGYTHEEYIEFYTQMLDYISEKKKQGINFNDSYRRICSYNMESPAKFNYMEERSPCGAAIGQIAYNRDGKIYTCDEGRMLGTMGDDSFMIGELDLTKDAKDIYQEIMKSNVAKVMANASYIDSIPGYSDNPLSSYIGVCPIYSYGQSHNIVSKYKREQRFRQQEAVFDKILDDLID